MNNPSKWADCTSIYPPAEEIAAALQDEGKDKTLKKKNQHVTEWKYPLIEKLAGKVFAAIQQQFNPEGFSKNATRAKQPLYKEIVVARKHVDINKTHPFFHKYGKEGKVFIITNSPQNCGLDLAIKSFQEFVDQSIQQKNSARTCNDGIRLGCILLDPAYRESVAGIMTKKKDRKKSDVPGDPATHFFEKILDECFSNPQYFVQPPAEEYYSEIPEDDKMKWDPNDSTIFEQTRSALWLRSTWEE
jgi:hypothetical protein